LMQLFQDYGTMAECDYKWGFGFIKFKEERSVNDAIKAVRGMELTPGKKVFFEVQGPNGEAKSTGIGSNGSIDDDDEKSVHAKIGPVCLFIGNLKEGTTVEEVTEVVEPFGDLKKVDVKGNFGFVHFKNPDSCREALSGLSRKIINGSHPRVQLGEIKRGGKVFVGNLHEDINQEELIAAFLAHGAVVEYKFVRQFAFFTYDDTADANRAVKAMNKKDICGVTLKVAISTADRAIANGDSDACHSCGQPGHISRYCPADKKDSCHKCGLSGHWAKECPNRSAGPPPPSYGGTSNSRVRSRSPPRRGGDSYGYPDSYHRGSRRY